MQQRLLNGAGLVLGEDKNKVTPKTYKEKLIIEQKKCLMFLHNHGGGG